MPRRRRLRARLARATFLLFLVTSIAFAAVQLWRHPPTPAVLGWRLAWADRLADPVVLQREYPWLARWSGKHARLQDRSLTAQRRRAAEIDTLARRAQRLGCPAVDDPAWEDCAVLQRVLLDRVAQSQWMLHGYRLNPMFGEHLALPGEILDVGRLEGLQAVELVLARAAAASARIADWQAWVDAQREAGIRPPRRMLAAVVRQIEEGHLAEAAESTLLRSFDEALDRWLAGDDARAAEARARMRQITDAQRPSWRGLVDALRAQLADSTQDFGAWAQPDGDAYYRFLLAQHGVPDPDPEALMARGQVEVSRLTAALQQRLDALGLDSGSLESRIRVLRERAYPTPNGSLASAEVVPRFESAMRAQAEILGAIWPGWQDQPVVLSVAGPARGPQAPLAAYLPRPGGPGMVQLAVRDRADWADWAILPLVRHEYLPGHHLQWTLQQLADLPDFRRHLSWTAFSEGWAMYAEGLQRADQSDDPLEQVGLLHSELLRAARMVVDPGLHYQRWSRSQAIEFLVQRAALPQRDAESEVDRYLAWPAQAVAFGVGLRHIRALRDRARSRLGAAFDELEFAQQLVTGGSVPLQQLDQRIERWLVSRSEVSPGVSARDAGARLRYAWTDADVGAD